MTSNPSNPFVLPGLGQSGEFATNPVMASMEMMRQAWQSLAAGQSGFGPPSMAASLSAEELERRITDLRAVENWLRMNLTVLSSTIQGLEVQRATLSTLKGFVNNASAMAGQDAAVLASLLGVKPDKPASAAKAATRQSRTGKSGTANAADSAPLFDSGQAVAATQAWWELLRKQFDSLAAATAASMQPDAPGTAGADTGATPAASAGKPATSQRKAASDKANRAVKSGNGSRNSR